jgi:hypothetical protein
MLILLDCRPLQHAGADNEKVRFLLSCAAGLTAQKGVKWLFLLNKRAPALSLPEGEKVLTGRSFRIVARTARKYKADLIMMTDGGSANATKVPQCSWVFGPPGSGKRLDKLRMRARAVFSFREIFPGVHVVNPPPEEAAAPLSVEAREKIKERLAEGKEYFYTEIAGAKSSEVINLLKAFSLFKKRQLSNMKLVLAGEDVGLTEKLSSYKYRQDVCLCPRTGVEQLAGAYAVISLNREGSLGIDVLNAWKAGVPVIAAEESEAVLRVPAGDPAPLADGLKSLYKDETLRNELIGKGARRVAGLSLGAAVGTIWDAIGRN